MKVTKTFELTFDEPDPGWLCAGNLVLALQEVCTNTKFEAKELSCRPPWPEAGKILLTRLIATWDELHKIIPGDPGLGFCDLEKALTRANIEIVNDVPKCQPNEKDLLFRHHSSTEIGDDATGDPS